MLYSADIIKAIARMIGELNIPLIVDPVMIAKGGESLLQQEAINALCSTLLPLATVVTPNIPEAETLTGRTIQHFEDIKDVAQSLLQLGVQCVIIKGGHLANPLYAIDYVFIKNGPSFSMQSPRIQTKIRTVLDVHFRQHLLLFLGEDLLWKKLLLKPKSLSN